MAITETRKKIHFVPFYIAKGRPVDTSAPPTVTLRNGNLWFPKATVEELSLNGKFIKLYYEASKKIIGFKVKEQVNLDEMKGQDRWKLVKVNPTGGSYSISLRKLLLTQFGEEYTKKVLKKIELKKYREMTDVMNRGEVFNFIEL